jgi:hypothetical protein
MIARDSADPVPPQGRLRYFNDPALYVSQLNDNPDCTPPIVICLPPFRLSAGQEGASSGV